VKKGDLLNFELTERVKQGEQVAFELLFKLYHAQLCNFAKLYVRFMDIAEEIVQDTFIKIWEIRKTLDPNQSLKALLFRCVHNNSINYIKKAKVNNKLSEEYIKEMNYRIQFLEQDTTDFDSLAEEELEIRIQKAIDELPAQCKEIFLLSRFNEMSYQQIADQLLISVNTVKTQLSRAMQKLRYEINPPQKQ
jgi:RNA polymerase sigma-70 factor, ECF subfamily